MALALVTDHITAALDRGQNVIGLFLDLRKAFDTVDFSILLSKLHYYGIRGNALVLFQNYLHGRAQAVSVNYARSEFLTVKCGVPQGSILGPLLFLVYINDLDKALLNARPALYADDTNIFLAGKNIQHMVNTFNGELTKLQK
jgi:hypothetical protein